MKTSLSALSVALFFSLTALPAPAQSTPVSEEDALNILKELQNKPPEPRHQAGAEPSTAALASYPPEIAEAVKQDFISVLDHNRELYAWNLFSSKLIFCVVLIVVASRLGLSAAQFMGYHQRSSSNTINEATNQEATESASKATDGAIKPSGGTKFIAGPVSIESHTVGLIILTVSLVFFYLYLHFVYRLERLGTP